MTVKTCLRCDWQGETKEARCPNCGEERSLFGSAFRVTGMPVTGHGEKGGPEGASTPSTDRPGGTSSTQSDPTPSPTDAVGSSKRSARSAIPFVIAALVLSITLGTYTWLNANGEGSVPAAPTDVAVLETPASVDLTDGPLVGRHKLTVDGVTFSFRVPTSGWELFGSLHISKSTHGSQGAEALIYWSRFPGGVDADWCALDRPEPGPSAADVAADVSTAPGTELVTGPSDVTVGGRAAKQVVLIVREDLGCDPGFFFNWKAKLAGALWTETDPGDTIRVWIVDVDGTRLFIAGEAKPDAGLKVEREIQQIVRSIRFG